MPIFRVNELNDQNDLQGTNQPINLLFKWNLQLHFQ